MRGPRGGGACYRRKSGPDWCWGTSCASAEECCCRSGLLPRPPIVVVAPTVIQSHGAPENSAETHFCHITRRLRGADAARSSLVTVLGLPRPIPTRTVAKPEPKPTPLGQDGGQKTPY